MILFLISYTTNRLYYNKGIEFEAGYQVCKNLNLDMNYSYLYMNKEIEAAPAHKLYASATYTPGRFTFNMSVQSIFDLYTTVGKTPEDNRKEDYTVLNARASYRFGSLDKGLKLFIKGENLTATRYSINAGYPMPKATFMAGIDVTF